MSTTAQPGSLRAEAELVLSQVAASPKDGAARAAQLVELAAEKGDTPAQLVALRALALSRLYGGDLVGALEAATEAIVKAEHQGLAAAIGTALLTLAALQAEQGALTEALRSVKRAEPLVGAENRAEASLYRATIHGLIGEGAAALAAFGEALVTCRAMGDSRMEVKVLHNRGTHHVEAGDFTAARLDLEAALEAGASLGLDAGTTRTRFNLARLAAFEGDLPDALRRAEALEAEAGADPLGLLDLVEGLLAARLFGEARRLAARAVERLDADGRTHAADARLRLAVAALAAGDWSAALADAERAGAAFRQQSRVGEAAEARLVAVDASIRSGACDAADGANEMLSVAILLDGTARRESAASARAVAARAFLGVGLMSEAAAALAPLAETSLPRTAAGRIRRRYAKALAAVAAGQTQLAARHLIAGLDELDRYRATLGATELQASITGLGSALAELGLDLAVASRRARRVFDWTERTRAASLRIAGERQPQDTELRRYLGQLRSHRLLGSELEQARLERLVVARSRALGGGAQRVDRPVDAATMVSALGDRALISFARHNDDIVSVVIADGRVSRGPTVSGTRVAGTLRTARFALDRLARPARSERLSLATVASFAAACGQLEALLIEPMARRIADRPLVIVPGGELTGLPWAALSALTDRCFVVAPSAASFLRAEQSVQASSSEARGPGELQAIAVAGPGLISADAEVERVLAHYRNAGLPVRLAVGVEDVLGALDGGAVLHIAAHGELRTDNPLLSALLLNDGPLTVYDLQQADFVPPVVILSACDAGLSAVRTGDELLGLTASLLHSGARSIVAACCPVPDDLSVGFMDLFHRSLVSGVGPASALRAVRTSVSGDVRFAAIASGYACHGAF